MKRTKRFVAWLGSDWRLPFVVVIFFAAVFVAGLKAQSISELFEQERLVRDEGERWSSKAGAEEKARIMAVRQRSRHAAQ